MQAALVKLVENNKSGFFQAVIALDHARKNTFGNNFDLCACAYLRFETNPEPYALSHILV